MPASNGSNEPRWLIRAIVEHIHDRQLREHGGGAGIGDEGLLDSALARPKNTFSYDERVDLCVLAAEYTFEISRNHPFVDGNKRTAFLAAYIFLDLNGLVIVSDELTVVDMVLAFSTGQVTVEQFAKWLRSVVEP